MRLTKGVWKIFAVAVKAESPIGEGKRWMKNLYKSWHHTSILLMLLLLLLSFLVYLAYVSSSLQFGLGPLKFCQNEPLRIANVRFFTGWIRVLSHNQQCQSVEGRESCQREH